MSFMKAKTILSVACPRCRSSGSVHILDKGAKFIFRMLRGNNRYVCHKCNITWREKTPEQISELKKGYDAGWF